MSSLRRIDPLIADSALALVIAVPLLVDLSNSNAPGPPLPFREADWLGYALVCLAVVPIAFRRRYPVGVFVACLAGSVLLTLFAYQPSSFGFGLIIATYTVGRWSPRRTSLAALGVAMAFAVFVKIRFQIAGVDIGWFAWPEDAVYLAAAWFLGDSIRMRAAQAAELQRQREALAEQAVATEHARIARELHDAVGHSLSVMVLHAGAGERIAERDPDRAREILASIAGIGRSALSETDELVTVLRSQNQHRAASVQNLDSLVDEIRSLGLPVELTVRGGNEVELPTRVDVSVYRIAQEALTNTLKHARASRAAVTLTYGDDEVRLTVADDGIGCAAPETNASDRHGLAGMRERARMLGGSLALDDGLGGRGLGIEAAIPVPAGPA